MSRTARPSSAPGAPAGPDTRPRAGWLYTPSWWERRFPWLQDVLASLDPAPLGRGLSALLTPFRAVVEVATQPLAAALDLVGRGVGWLWAGLWSIGGAGMAALPLPGAARRSLFLPIRADQAYPLGAQHALRRQHAVVLPLALMAAAGAHAVALISSPTFGAADLTRHSDEVLAIELPPEIPIPPPPEQLVRPAAPVIASTQVDDDITIAPTTFDDFAPRDLPPPPPQVTDDPAAQPTFTPFTVAPRILNADLIEELMATRYPPRLRDAGIGGTVVVWAYIDRDGLVEEVRLAQSSGFPALDEAGLSVAEHIRASPALNRDVTIAVWVQLPLEFEVR